jgi:glycosyltransferase involved in cell wall biosynthesis
MRNKDTFDPPLFSLVFLTWNSEAVISRSLDSVLDQTINDYEIIVVDNDSQDRTVAILQEYASAENIHVIENESNLGFTRGINCGIKATNGQYICCYNDDTYFPPTYLETLADTVNQDTVWTTARRNYRVSVDRSTVRLLTAHRFPIPYIVDSLRGNAVVDFVPGDGLIVPRTIYEEELDEQIFDPEMPERGEDMYLSLRLQDRDVQMKAILDTYSIHPDEGFYAPSIENAINHFRNVYARFRAYQKNQAGLFSFLAIFVSGLTVPLEIYFGTFPRPTEAFRNRTTIEQTGGHAP